MAAAGEGKSRSPFARAMGRFVARPRAFAPAVRCEEPAPPAAAPAGLSAPPAEPPAPQDAPPVQFEMFSKEWSQMAQQDNWDGFRIEMANQVTKFVQASHTLFLGTQLRECGYIYQFGPAFQSEDQRTVLVSRIGLDGGVNGRVVQKVGQGMELKGTAQSHMKDPQRNMYDAAVDYTGKDWTGGLKVAWQGALLGGGSFSQRILPTLHVGGDVTAVAVNNLMVICQGGLRYSDGKDTVVAAVTRQPDPKSPVGANVHELKMQYTRRFSDRLALGAEYKYSHPTMESGLSAAYEYTFRNAHVQGLLDTDGKVSCCVFDMQGLGFSGMIDYVRGDYKFGVVMQVMPPDQGQPAM